MAERKIQLDDWVYKTLKKYGNVALPYYANDIKPNALVNHLSSKVGFKVKLRQAKMSVLEDMNVVEKPYYIAEEKYENHSQN